MPLIAMLDGKRVDATTHDKSSWDALQASEDRKRLVMPVCNIRAVAKTRGQTTRFFAHYSLNDCAVDHGGESPQHLAMKEALARGIDEVSGWHAIIEHPHPSREWIIDVLAESDDKAHRVAFEVQLSSQTPEDYSRRTQRYFESNVFPVWLVPRSLEYGGPIQLPIVVTGFGKTSEAPANPTGLLDLDISHNLPSESDVLRDFIRDLLTSGPRWRWGTPMKQQENWDAEQRRRVQQQLADAQRQAQAKEAVEKMNRRSIAPEKAFQPHTVHTESGPFVWASLTDCWKCGLQMMVWEAASAKQGEPYSSAPGVVVKNKVGLKRYENHPDVHQAIDTWIAQSGAKVSKARIEQRSSQGKGESYSAFICPGCSALMGQVFVAQISSQHWSIISAPLLRRAT